MLLMFTYVPINGLNIGHRLHQYLAVRMRREHVYRIVCGLFFYNIAFTAIFIIQKYYLKYQGKVISI